MRYPHVMALFQCDINLSLSNNGNIIIQTSTSIHCENDPFHKQPLEPKFSNRIA